MKLIQTLLRLPFDLWLYWITYFPGNVGDKLRYYYWKRRLGSLGKKSIISIGVHFESPGFVFIGKKTWIDRNVYIIAGKTERNRATYKRVNPNFTHKTGEIHIGNECHIAPNCVINGMGGIHMGNQSGIASGSMVYSYSHHYRNLSDLEDKKRYSFSNMTSEEDQVMISGPIVIGQHSAIGLNCVVLPGVSIGEGAWVGAGNTVISDLPYHHILQVGGKVKALPQEGER